MPSTVSPIGNGSTKTNDAHPKNEVEEPTEDEVEDLDCGYSLYKPDWMQVFNRPQAVLAFLSFAAFVQGFIVNGVINVNMSTLERRFGFTSTNAGWIASVYDLTAAPVALFVCFMASGGHKLRWVGQAMIVFSLGSFIMAMPHFFADSYKWGSSQTTSCSNTSEACNPSYSDSNLQEYLGVFLLGQMFHSVGGCVLYTLGITTLDDVVNPRKTPLYIGIMMCFATLGPAVGYILGGQLLDVFVDQKAGVVIPFDATDPRWVGAWWVCFLISGSLAILIGPVLLGYARELPVAKEIQKTRECEAHQGSGSKEGTNAELNIHNLPSVTRSLFKNPSFMFISLSSAAEGLSVSGLSTFMPKFIENQFGETASMASLLSGIVAIPGAAGGQILGGLICRKFGLRVHGQLILIIICLIIGLFMNGIFWAQCDTYPFAGITIDYNEQANSTASFTFDSEKNLDSKCNAYCHCSTESYIPVCGSNGIQYFSPCYAGCTGYDTLNKTYSGCKCVTDTPLKGMATEGKCAQGKCTILYAFLGVLFVNVLCIFVAQTPLVSVILRCIPDSQRTYGIGITNFIGRLLGTLPGPLLFGYAIDKSCKVWKKDCTGDTSCWIYENKTMALNFFLLTFIVRLFSLAFLFIAKCLYKAPTTPKAEDKVYTVSGNSACPNIDADTGAGNDNEGYDTKL